jgi:predicted transposase/invertase (TIGR01784 family)
VVKTSVSFKAFQNACCSSGVNIDGLLWRNDRQVHHTFRLTDAESGRILDGTLEVHTLELRKYNVVEQDLAAEDMLGRWLYWLLHAQDYEVDELLRLFSDPAMQQATLALAEIAAKTESKAMYDAREKAIRDRESELAASHREGKIEGKIEGRIEGKIELIRTLEGLLYLPLSDEQALLALGLPELEALTARLQEKLRNRPL